MEAGEARARPFWGGLGAESPPRRKVNMYVRAEVSDCEGVAEVHLSPHGQGDRAVLDQGFGLILVEPTAIPS